MSEPKVTIGIPCYNAADTIARAIQSAAKQNWKNVEIIIVDDCSSDSSADVAEDAIRAILHARLIRHPRNTGAAGARNTILKEASGEYIAFFDDDDESLPERVTLQVGRLESYTRETGVIHAACYVSGRRVYDNGYTLDMQAVGRKPVIPHGPEMANNILFFKRNPGWCYGGVPSCALMARKATFEAAGGFDPAFRRIEDLDFAVRLALMGGHFIGCSESLLIQHATSAADKSPEKNLEAETLLAEKYKEYLKSTGRYYYAREWPRLRYYHFRRRYGRLFATLLGLFVRNPVTVAEHFLTTAPKRLIHERKMKKVLR